MTIKLTNLIIGLILILISISTIIPLTIQIFQTNGGGFGFGALLLPAVLPLSVCTIFGLFGIIDYEKNYSGFKKLFIGSHILTAIIGTATFFLMPLFPFIIVSIPIALILITTMTVDNVGRHILINNGLILTCMSAIMTMMIISSERSFIERMTYLWQSLNLHYS